MSKFRRNTITDDIIKNGAIPERSVPGVGNYQIQVPKLEFKTFGNGHSSIGK
jgi:hypothetical protein